MLPDPFDEDGVVEALAEEDALTPADAVLEAVAPAEEGARPAPSVVW